MRFIFAILVLLGCSAARAELGELQGAGGTLQPLPGQGRQMRLVRERVQAYIYARRIETTLSFELRNEGPARAVAVAFPEGEDESNRFQSFAMTLDGRRVKARRVVSPRARDETGPTRWLTRVPFRRGQSRVVRVRLRSGTENLLHSGSFEYGFDSGGWRGDVEESTVSVTFRAPGTYLCGAYLSLSSTGDPEDEAVSVRRSGSSLLFERRKWQPRGDFTLSFDPTFAPGWLDYDGIGPRQHSVTVPGSPVGVQGVGFWLPIALVRNGTAYVSLDELDNRINPHPYYEARSKALQWKEGSRSATLRAGKHALSFRAGRKSMRADGKAVALPGAPFIESGAGHDSGGYSYFYVPLVPVLRVLGGTASVDARAHRITFRGPLLHKPTED